MWKKLVDKIVEDWNLGDYDPFVWLAKKEMKKYKASLDLSSIDGNLARSAIKDLKEEKILTREKFIALHRLRKNFEDVFMENTEDLEDPSKEDLLYMDELSVEEAIKSIEERKKAYSRIIKQTEGLNDWNKYKSITSYIKKYEDEQYDANYTPDYGHDTPVMTSFLDDVD